MAVVAGVALGLAVAGLMAEGRKRAADRYRVAYGHAIKAGLTPLSGGVELRLRQRDYHRKLMRKWIDASKHPWSPVAPDPPEPED
jgi:hypothetical protein